MQFVKLDCSYYELMATIRAIPEAWWKSPMGQIQSLISDLRERSMDLLARYATQVSTEIARSWLGEQTLKALKAAGMTSNIVSGLVNCMVSEERIVTFNIPLEFTKMTDFYQVKISPSPTVKNFVLEIFYPKEHKSTLWYGKIAAKMTYELKMSEYRVLVDGDSISIKAWNAVCAMAVAQGVGIGCEGIVMDMARDGEI